MSQPLQLNDTNFTETVAGSPIVVFFMAANPPCEMVAPHLPKLVEKYTGRIRIGELAAHNNPDTITDLQISTIPATWLFDKSGRVVASIHGTHPLSRYVAMIDRFLKSKGDTDAPSD